MSDTTGSSPASDAPEPAADPRHARLSGAERLALAAAIALLLFLSEVPFLLARVDLPEGLALVRRPPGNTAVYPTLLAAEDYPQYLAAIREAARTGSLRSRNPFSTEPHDPVLLRPFYSIVGFVAGRCGVPAELAYHLAGLLARAALLAALYRFAACFFRRPGARWVAFLVAVSLSGLGGWLEVLLPLLPEEVLLRYRVGIERTEWNTFTVLFHHPHLAAGLALLLEMARRVIHTVARPRPVDAVAAALLTGALSLTNLFSVVPLGASVALLLLLVCVLDGRVPWRPGVLLGLGGLAGVPFLLYATRVYGTDPFWKETYGTATGQATPAPDVVLFHLAPVVALAVVGASPFLRGARAGSFATTARRIAGVWIVATAFLMYFPLLGFRIRVAFGLLPFLSLPAAAGLLALFERGVLGRVLAAAVVAAGLVTPGFWASLLVRAVEGKTELHYTLLYRPTPEVEGALWLMRNSDADDRVLASYESGNFLAGLLRGSVYLGHDSGTRDAAAKKREVERFFREMDPEESRRFLRERGIDFVYYGTFELRRFGPWDPERLGDVLEPVHRTAGVHVFRVRGDTD